MTTITLIAGMIPVALGSGPGAASRASMVKVIIGGQALSLFGGAKARLHRNKKPEIQTI